MHRSQTKLILMLSTLVGSFAYIIILAVINGSLGFLAYIAITLFGTIGIAKLLGSAIAISWFAIFFIIITCGIVRSVLRYFEQYSNHYIAFKLLAIIRDKIFNSLRKLAPAKLEGK